MDKKEEFDIESFRYELERILSWWAKNIIVNDRIIGRIDGHGIPYPDAPLGVVYMTRILWSFSAAARKGYMEYMYIAEAAYNFIRKYLIDHDYGGLYWMVDANGVTIESKKQTYAQAFGVYAFSEYFQLTNDPEALYHAQHLFYLIEKKTKDEVFGGYREAMTEQWEPMEDVRLSEKEANDSKTMNTHLHILESYTNFYRSKQTVNSAAALKNLIQLYVDKFIDSHDGRLKLFFNDEWKENFTHHSYGHEIESAWLLHEAATVYSHNNLIQKARELSVRISDRVLEQGIDIRGAVYNEKSAEGIYDNQFDWWPQAEAVVGFYDAYIHTGNQNYYFAAHRCFDFIRKYIIDKNSGAWHWAVDSDGNPNLEKDKAGPWIAPYHSSRMCLEMITRLSK